MGPTTFGKPHHTSPYTRATGSRGSRITRQNLLIPGLAPISPANVLGATKKLGWGRALCHYELGNGVVVGILTSPTRYSKEYYSHIVPEAKDIIDIKSNHTPRHGVTIEDST